jgi:c-di-GMP-binding flagellar brake protein YcgR
MGQIAGFDSRPPVILPMAYAAAMVAPLLTASDGLRGPTEDLLMPPEDNAQEITQEVWVAALERSEARNAPVELQRLAPDGRDEFAPMLKSRMLGLDQTQMVIEEPSGNVAAEMLQPGAPVMLYIVEGDDRWEFETHVLETTRFALNASVRVQALRLASPKSASKAQRRDFYRVNTAGVVDQPVQVTAAIPHSQGDTEEIIELEGRLVNIGGGGMGLTVNENAARRMLRAKKIHCRVTLPTLNHPLEVNVRVAHSQQEARDIHYMGLQFVFQRPAARDQVADKLCYFAAWLQRQRLNRRAQRAAG